MENYTKHILSGKIFIYPTDTVYGLGCNAEDKKTVEKIKQIKKRDKDKPLSIIAPSKEWIKKHCVIDVKLNKYLPGPYTLILRKKDPDFLNYVSPTEFIGVRIPTCPFSLQVSKAKVPFISTSVNFAGEPFATSIKEIPKQILKKADIIIDKGKLNGQPSILIKDGKEIKR
jgi:L-threonylcarbamoyladenylate synthase